MKKNKMMRLASGLLVAVLITTSTISGTYAKYVTEASGTDSARVAKWGVEVGVYGSLFENAYTDAPVEYDATETDNQVRVWATEADDLVAPGTESAATGVKLTIKGQPEVDTLVTAGIDVVSEVCLPAGTYTDYTEVTSYDASGNPVYENTFTVPAEGYYPIVYTLTNDAGTAVATGKLADINTYLADTLSGNYEAETDLATIGGGAAGTYVLTWKWEFGATGSASGNDAADTYLGNVAAGTVTDAKAVTAVEYEFSVLVEQVD